MKFIKVCEVSLGQDFTCIFHWVNVEHIVSISVEKSNKKFCLLPFITLSNGERYLIVYRSDLVDLIGEKAILDFENYYL